MDLTEKIDKLIVDTTVVGDVEPNKTKGNVDVIGGKCPDGMVYCKARKTCVPAKNEGFVYVYNKKKDKRIRISDDPKVMEKYKKKGYIVETSITGDTYVSGNSTIAGSGQTRIVGAKRNIIDILSTKEPIEDKMDDKSKENLSRYDTKFDIFLGAYVPKK